MKKTDTLLERLKKGLPEFRGYQDKEYIADSDRVLRYDIASVLERLKLELEKVQEILFEAWKLPARGSMEALELRIETLAKRLRASSFEREEMPELPEEKLETLYEYDLALLDHIEGLWSPIDKLATLKDSPEEIEEEISFLNHALDRLEEQYDKRQNLF